MRWPLGAACGFVLLLSPAVLPSADAVVPAVLPLGFYAAGATAQVLRPGHPVGDRLLAVGVLHLTALVGAVVVGRWPATAVPVAGLSAVLYALGFVALLDLLARYPTGRYAWPVLSRAVPVAAAAAVVVATLAVLGSARTPSVLDLDSDPNPLHVPALAALAPAVAVVALLPVAGLVLLLVRYRQAPPTDRAQMRWPLVTTAVIALALVSTAWAEDVLGPEAQAALFVTAGVALPVSFLVGLLRHTEEADRLAEVAASRARLAEVADAERRRIERDLHDGAQQSILALMARVEIARARLPATEDGVDAELRDIGTALRDVHRELRELARGVHPAVLTDHGLPEAVRSALTRLPCGHRTRGRAGAGRRPAPGRHRGRRLFPGPGGPGQHLQALRRRRRRRHPGLLRGAAGGDGARFRTRVRRAGGRARLGARGHGRPAGRRRRPPGRGEPAGCRHRPPRAAAGAGPCRLRPSTRSRRFCGSSSPRTATWSGRGSGGCWSRRRRDGGLAAVPTADELLDAVARLGPDAVLTDIRMPPGHSTEGIRAAHAIRAAHPGVGVVVLSQHADAGYVLDLLQHGSDGLGYLLKERVGDRAQLVAALRETCRGGSVIDPVLVDALVGRRRLEQASGLADLTRPGARRPPGHGAGHVERGRGGQPLPVGVLRSRSTSARSSASSG